MFTGLVEEIGVVRRIRRASASCRIEVGCRRILEGLETGDSVAVSGVCLTAVDIGPGSFAADIMPETLRMTSLDQIGTGSPVNLERAMRLGDRLGGHLVTGHIDGVGRIVSRRREAEAIWLDIAVSKQLGRYIIRKGSVAVEGVSLTVADLTEARFSVSLIPHSADVTTLGSKKTGDWVNIECDEIAKYIERLLSTRQGGKDLSLDFLEENGFA